MNIVNRVDSDPVDSDPVPPDRPRAHWRTPVTTTSTDPVPLIVWSDYL